MKKLLIPIMLTLLLVSSVTALTEKQEQLLSKLMEKAKDDPQKISQINQLIKDKNIDINKYPKLSTDYKETSVLSPTPASPSKGPGSFLLITLLTIITVIAAVLFLYFRVYNKHIEQTQGQLNKESQLKAYVTKTLNQGFTKDQIKHVLLKEGWDEKALDKVLKNK